MMIWRQGWLSSLVADARQETGVSVGPSWCNSSIYGLFHPLSCIIRCKISQCGNYGRHMALDIHTAAASGGQPSRTVLCTGHSFARVSNPGFPQSHRHHRGWNLNFVLETVIELLAVSNDSLLWTLTPHGEVSAI
jgi:hypothetical protein